jgi:cytoskeleton protein RodZ
MHAWSRLAWSIEWVVSFCWRAKNCRQVYTHLSACNSVKELSLKMMVRSSALQRSVNLDSAVAGIDNNRLPREISRAKPCVSNWQASIAKSKIRCARSCQLPSFGEKLKSEREKRKITLDQISSSTKIGTRMLQALEEDKFSQLPGGIFNKGFVRAYARTVGLDEEQTVAEYLLASGDAPPVRAETAARGGSREGFVHHEEEGRLEIRAEAASRQLPWGVFAVVLLGIALALSIWTHRREQEHQLAQTSPEKVSASSAPVGHPPPSSPALEPSSVSEHVNSSAAVPPAGTAENKPSSITPTAGSASSKPSATTSSSSLSASGELELLIFAREESWVSISVDGKSSSSATLFAGEERTVRAAKDIVLKTGNAGALDVRLNGKKLDTGGQFGEVKTFVIGPAGLVPSAPSPNPPLD